MKPSTKTENENSHRGRRSHIANQAQLHLYKGIKATRPTNTHTKLNRYHLDLSYFPLFEYVDEEARDE